MPWARSRRKPEVRRERVAKCKAFTYDSDSVKAGLAPD
jgi:hypothetical protein